MRKGLEGPAASEVLTPRSVCNGRAHTTKTALLENFLSDNNDAVDVIASRLRHLHYLRQVVLRATLTKQHSRSPTKIAPLVFICLSGREEEKSG
jgi:hypothetical protein